MLIRSKIPWRSMLQQLWPVTLAVACYSIAVSWLDARFHLEQLQLPIALVTLPGAFVGVLLAFRTNSSYARWWEARTLWGRIVNDSRTWTRQVVAFVGRADTSNRDDVTQLAHRQIAWCRLLTRSLRHQDSRVALDDVLSAEDSEFLSQHDHPANAILVLQALQLSRLRSRETIDTWQQLAMEDTLARLTDAMGGCERIRNTPFPPHYGLWIHYLIYLSILLLPLSLVQVPAVGLILLTVPIAMGYLIIEQVAIFLESPFQQAASGTPMSSLTRTIEINIRQLLGEAETPNRLAPVDGVLL
ncbi:MAG: bestrophin family ion channel [Planctomycetota bacterium]